MPSIGFHSFEVRKVYFIIDISFEMRMKKSSDEFRFAYPKTITYKRGVELWSSATGFY